MAVGQRGPSSSLLHVFALIFRLLLIQLEIQVLVPGQINLARVFDLAGTRQYLLQITGLQLPMLLANAYFR